MEVPSSDIGFVRTGIADLGIDSFPAADFGVVEGKVVQVGSTHYTKPSGAKNEYRFPTTISVVSEASAQKRRQASTSSWHEPDGEHQTEESVLPQLLLGSFKEKPLLYRRSEEAP